MARERIATGQGSDVSPYKEGLVTFKPETFVPLHIHKPTQLDGVSFGSCGNLVISSPRLPEIDSRSRTLDSEGWFDWRIHVLTAGATQKAVMEDFDGYRQQIAWVVTPVHHAESTAEFDQVVLNMAKERGDYFRLDPDSAERAAEERVRDSLSEAANLRYQYALWAVEQKNPYGSNIPTFLNGLAQGTIGSDIPSNMRYLAKKISLAA